MLLLLLLLLLLLFLCYCLANQTGHAPGIKIAGESIFYFIHVPSEIYKRWLNNLVAIKDARVTDRKGYLNRSN